MTRFIPVDYHGKKYPHGMKCDVKELAGHLDKTSIPDVQRYSLHTEYSFTKRRLDSALIERYPALKESYRNVPRLWFSEEWAEEFAEFIFDLTDGHPDPEVIEIHPPFRDYCSDFDTFLDRYTVFEDIVLNNFPDTLITMENRAGAQYPTTFLMTTIDDVADCCDTIEDRGCRLHIAMDYPQLFTAEGYDYSDIPIDAFIEKHTCLEGCKKMISSIHLWGKKQNDNGRWVSHAGGLKYILPEDDLDRFMNMLSTFYDDGIERYFVPEINSSEIYIEEIVDLCVEAGIEFIG